MATTYNNLYLDARRELKQAGVEAAQLEARELLCFALDISRDVLIPRPDTETLVDRGIVFVKDLPDGARVLDLCAGSGCVGLAVAASCPNTRVILADWSEDALRVCRQNVRRCNLTAQVSVIRANALEAPSSALWDFDLILCNPPYIPTGDLAGLDASVRDYEPVMARMTLTLDFYRAVASGWKSALRPGGMLAFEIGYDQAPAVEYIMAGQGYENIETFKDPGDHWRVVEGILN